MKLLKRLNSKLLSLLPKFIPVSKGTQEKYRALYYTPWIFLLIWISLGGMLRSLSLLSSSLFFSGVGFLLLGYMSLKEKIDVPFEPEGIIDELPSLVSKGSGKSYLYWVIWYLVKGGVLVAASFILFLVKSNFFLPFLGLTSVKKLILLSVLSLLNYYSLFALWFQRFFWPKGLSGKFKVYYKKEATIRAILLFVFTSAGLILLPITK